MKAKALKGASAAEVIERRQAAHLTQRRSAELVGVTVQAWQMYEWGQRRIAEPTWRLFKLLTEKRIQKEKQA